ncbi:hypothetical protein EVAR_46785_1 [Eumeta japonica]|uniref:Uncharacterized protein n=1 Tax=Eumeta variegata TaxID=151549 RepID=A0A4C1XF95_EUMVA|nr:hypothetical protein EVAR_46785_1 [Eumeta japonica]
MPCRSAAIDEVLNGATDNSHIQHVASGVFWSVKVGHTLRKRVRGSTLGERQMSNAAGRGGRLCLFVARSALSLALQALNGTPQSEVTLHESCFSCVQSAPSNYKTLSRQKLVALWGGERRARGRVTWAGAARGSCHDETTTYLSSEDRVASN